MITDDLRGSANLLVGGGQVSCRSTIGLHFGEVLVGNIGDEPCLEYTVLGDPVNIAQRSECLTRSLDVARVIGGALIAEVCRIGVSPEDVVPGLNS